MKPGKESPSGKISDVVRSGYHRVMIVKVRCLKNLHQNHEGIGQRCKFSDPIQDLLNQKLQKWAP